MKTKFVGLFCLATLIPNAWAYNIVDRARLIDDKFKTLEMMKPYGHNFFTDINATVSTDTMDLRDDADKIENIDSGNTDDDIDQVNTILRPYYNQEQVLRANVNFGIPLFSFEAMGVSFEPNFRFGGGLLAVLTPQSEQSTLTTLIDNLDQVPVEVRSSLKSCLNALGPADDGKDLLVLCVQNGSVTQAQVDQLKDVYGVTKVPYSRSLATSTQETPFIDVYAKIEAKAGLWFDYEKGENFFGTVGLYGLGRLDIRKRADALLLLGGGASLDVADNRQINAALDYRFGYRVKNYTVFAAVEELKLAEVSSEDLGAPAFGSSALIRTHAQADYSLGVVKLSPYLGFHKRSGYGLDDGLYIGADTTLQAWEQRLGLTVKTQLDKEHLTLGALARLWIAHVDLTAKFAVKDNLDGVKLANYYAANLRFFF